MGHVLDDIIRHNSWANRRLLEFCQGIDATALDATVPGTYGTIIATLRHLVGSECSYLFRLSGADQLEWRDLKDANLDMLRKRLDVLSAVWESYLAGDTDPERQGEARGDDGEVYAVPAGVFVTQAMHHGNEHRAHICTILGALGYEAPEVSGWLYAETTGRMTLKSGSSVTAR